MMIRYAIALAIVLILAASAAWAFLPARYLPGNRARHLRIRLHLRLHPGMGFAHFFSLHLRWGRLAALRRSARIRPSLPLRCRLGDSGEHAVFLGRAHYRHGLRVPRGYPTWACWSPPPGSGKTTPYRRDKLDDQIAMQVGQVRHTITLAREPAAHAPALPGSGAAARPTPVLLMHQTAYCYGLRYPAG